MRNFMVMIIMVMVTMSVFADRLEVKTLETSGGLKVVQSVFDTDPLVNDFCDFDANDFCVPMSIRNFTYHDADYDDYFSDEAKTSIYIKNPYFNPNSTIMAMTFTDENGIVSAEIIFTGVVDFSGNWMYFLVDDNRGEDVDDFLIQAELTTE